MKYLQIRFVIHHKICLSRINALQGFTTRRFRESENYTLILPSITTTPGFDSWCNENEMIFAHSRNLGLSLLGATVRQLNQCICDHQSYEINIRLFLIYSDLIVLVILQCL